MPTFSALNLISDIELQLNQGAISDDSELSRSQIAYWIEYELNNLVQQECEIAMKQGKPLPSIYINRISGMRSSEENYIIEVAKYSDIAASNPTGDYSKTFKVTEEETILEYTYSAYTYYKFNGYKNSQQQYIQITKEEAERRDFNQRVRIPLSSYSIMNLSKEAGIVRLLTDEYEVINKSTVDTLDMVKELRFAGPSADKLVWYKEGDFLYIEGLSDPDIEERSFIMDYVISQRVTENSSVQVSELIFPSLIDRVVQRGKLQMYGSTPDIANDGVDTKQSAYHSTIANPTKSTQTEQQ